MLGVIIVDRRNKHLGNRHFKQQFTTDQLVHAIENADEFESFADQCTDDLIDGNALMKDYLKKLLKVHKVTKKELAEATQYHYDYLCKILRGERGNPDRDLLLAICVHIRATVEETQTLLGYAGQPQLYVRKKRDAIIWHVLMKKQGLTILGIQLAEHGYAHIVKETKENEE